MNITEQLNYIKKTYNLTQKQMAQMAGISQATMSDWLKGNVNPTIYYLNNLADGLNITIDYLVGRENEDGTIYIMQNQLSNDENKLVDYVRQLNNKNKEIVYRYVEFLLDQQSKGKL